MSTPSIADLLLNRPVQLPDGSIWTYRRRRVVESAEVRQEKEMMRKRAKALLKKERQVTA